MRFYLSNIRPAWPVERQEAVLDERSPGWRDLSVYRDILSAARRKTHSADDLKDRATLLRPTTRQGGETITVASIAVIAVSQIDLLGVIAALGGRLATLEALAEGLTVRHDARPAEVQAACAAFALAIHRARGDRHLGAHVSAANRAARAKAACEKIKERWGMPNSVWPNSVLLAEADVSGATAVAYLGKRKEVQREYARRVATIERNQQRRKTDVEA